MTAINTTDTTNLKERAQSLLAGRELGFSLAEAQSARWNLERYEYFVEQAASLGATHISVGELPFEYGSWVLPDDDPYAAWCIHSPSLLRICPPPALKEFLPQEDTEQSQNYIEQQLTILRRHGLKGTCSGVEPMWLPEAVYRAHPKWRGAQCELGRIACRAYFAPSIDEPEVCELYRHAMREFCERFPEIDQLSFLTNDSGSGIPWSVTLYPGMNGPAKWRTRDGGERIAQWYKAIQQGAEEAGGKIRMNVMGGGITAETATSARNRLTPGLYVRSVDCNGDSPAVAGASMGSGIWCPTFPVTGLAEPTGFIQGLQQIFHNPDGDNKFTSIGIGPDNMELAFKTIRTFLNNPGRGSVHHVETTLQIAKDQTGSEEGAEELVSVWKELQSVIHAMNQLRQKGFTLVMPFSCVSMRWLIRPLVPQPHLLTDEQTEYFRRRLFMSGALPEHENFHYVLGKAVFVGESVVWMARWCLQEAIEKLRRCRTKLKRLAEVAPDAKQQESLSLEAARYGALACVATTIRNAIMYQYALDIAHVPQYGPNQIDYDDNIIYDQRALNMRKIAREEVDNTAELIELIESQSEKVIDHADRPEQESVFVLGPDIVGDLRRKLDLMMDHWHDYEVLYPTTLVWEPQPPTPKDSPYRAEDFDSSANPEG